MSINLYCNVFIKQGGVYHKPDYGCSKSFIIEKNIDIIINHYNITTCARSSIG